MIKKIHKYMKEKWGVRQNEIFNIMEARLPSMC